MKKIVQIISVVLITLGVFAAGLFIGFRIDFAEQIATGSYFDDAVIEGSKSFHMIQNLDSGQPDKVRDLLILNLAGSVSSIDLFLDDFPNDEKKKQATVLLKKIAKYEDEHGLKLKDETKDTSFVLNKVREIIKRAEK